MVSAVFHSPFAADSAHAEPAPGRAESATLRAAPSAVSFATSIAAITTAVAPEPKASRPPFDWRALALTLLPPIFGLVLLVGIWALVSITTASSIPSPIETFKQAMVIFADPFYRKGPNDHASDGIS